MLGAASLPLQSYAFHFPMKNNVKCTRQGGHKVEINSVACDCQPIPFFVY